MCQHVVPLIEVLLHECFVVAEPCKQLICNKPICLLACAVLAIGDVAKSMMNAGEDADVSGCQIEICNGRRQALSHGVELGVERVDISLELGILGVIAVEFDKLVVGASRLLTGDAGNFLLDPREVLADVLVVPGVLLPRTRSEGESVYVPVMLLLDGFEFCRKLRNLCCLAVVLCSK
jgi:hypothetical protein